MSSVITLQIHLRSREKRTDYFCHVDRAGRGVGMVLAEIAVPLYEREHLTGLIREQGRGAIL
jgi:hypothetical protein